MGFTLDDIVIDRVQYGYAEDLSGNPLYALTQLQDATINISAESTDATDNQGNLIKRFWKAKTGEFTANNAMINLNVIGAASGEGKRTASSTNKIKMPKIITVKANDLTTSKTKDTYSLAHPRFIEVRKDKTVADSFEIVLESRDSMIDLLKRIK